MERYRWHCCCDCNGEKLMSPIMWITWAFVLILQNFAFTFVSRARNSGSLSRHMVAGVFSNGVWFVSQILIFSQLFQIMTGKYGFTKAAGTALYYTIFTLLGSLLAHYWSLNHEKGKAAVGANKKYAQITTEQWDGVKALLYKHEVRTSTVVINPYLTVDQYIELEGKYNANKQYFPQALVNRATVSEQVAGTCCQEDPQERAADSPRSIPVLPEGNRGNL
jgi:hypothetical protein